MDSLTQVVLGAAVGEVTLGKKVGPRAMLWGALGGFLPDADVAARFFMDEMSALAAHRGFSHSIVFAAGFSFFLAWLVQKLYSSGLYRNTWFKVGGSILTLGLVMFTANYLPFMVMDRFNWSLFMWTVAIAAIIFLILYRFYIKPDRAEVNTTYRDWYWLFFWSILTHPILDCFTTYGTQLFLPFTDYRVAFNVISVADPLYTAPFLLCVLIAAFLPRTNVWRARINWLGIGLSSAYMLFCVYHKVQVNQVFEESFAEKGIEVSRYMTSPMILNNVLWIGVGESDTAFYHGYYSFSDEEVLVKDFNLFPKNHELIDEFKEDRDLNILRWFSKDYYSISERDDGNLQYNDLRFGIFGFEYNSYRDFIFKFILQKENGKLHVFETDEGREINAEVFQELMDRILGR